MLSAIADYSPFWLSLKIAGISTLAVFCLGVPAARLVMSMKRCQAIADCLLSLPLVLPPTVAGFFLLQAFGRNGWLSFLQFVFTWQGAAVAAALVSFPLMYRTARAAFEAVDPDAVNAARTIGMSETEIFFRILIPNAVPGLAAGLILSFARAVGEFGATIMMAGNIPGKTQTMSVAVYTAVQGGNNELAYAWVLLITVMSFAMILLLNVWQKRCSDKRGSR